VGSATPELAVIVGDFDRRRYLAGALGSLAAQTLDRSRYEVVVLRGYDDPVLDRGLAANGIHPIVDRSPRIGAWLQRAIAATTAPVLTFLNDDDEYAPERLARVVRSFQQDPDLGFYRNRVSVINSDGTPRPEAEWRVHERDGALDTTGPIHLPAADRARAVEVGLRTTHASFNTSTMAVRRELLTGELAEAFSRTQTDDLFLFVAAVLSGRSLLLDDRRLTRFRFHPGSLTDEVRWLGEAEASYRELATLSSRGGVPFLTAWLTDRAVHFGRMFRGDSVVESVAAGEGRRSVARRTGEYLRFLGRHPKERSLTLDTWAAGAYGLAYAAGAPGVARLARTRLRARARR